MIGACIAAELAKLRRRPAVWVLGGVYAAVVLLFNYLIVYVLVSTGALDEQGATGLDQQQILDSLLPAQFDSALVSTAVSLGSAVALILGALAVGSEYGWGTVKTVAVQRPGRGAIATGRLVSVTVVTLVYTLVALAVAVLASAVVGVVEGGSLAAPPVGDVLLAFGAAWLVLSVWAGLGMALATLFRGTGLAIGLGLVWALVIESLAATIPLPGDIGDAVASALLGTNGNALASYFGESADTFGAPVTANSPEVAALVLLAYLAVFALLIIVPFRRREIA